MTTGVPDAGGSCASGMAGKEAGRSALVALLVTALASIMLLSYRFIIPVKYRWVSHQQYKHDNPLAMDVRALREELSALRRDLEAERRLSRNGVVLDELRKDIADPLAPPVERVR